MNDHRPSNAEIVSHLEERGNSNDLSWIKPDDHFKVDELALNGLWLVYPGKPRKYHWVAIKVIRTYSTLYIVIVITSVDTTVENISDWLVLLNM